MNKIPPDRYRARVVSAILMGAERIKMTLVVDDGPYSGLLLGTGFLPFTARGAPYAARVAYALGWGDSVRAARKEVAAFAAFPRDATRKLVGRRASVQLDAQGGIGGWARIVEAARPTV